MRARTHSVRSAFLLALVVAVSLPKADRSPAELHPAKHRWLITTSVRG